MSGNELNVSVSELDDMVSSAIEAAIETSPEFSYGWRAMPDKDLIPEILDEIPIEYTEKDIAEAIYRYKVRLLKGESIRAALSPQPVTKPAMGGGVKIERDYIGKYEKLLRDAVEPFLDWLEQREEGAHIKEVREGLIGVEDVIPDNHVVLGAHPRSHKDHGVITIGHFRRLLDAYEGRTALTTGGEEL